MNTSVATIERLQQQLKGCRNVQLEFAEGGFPILNICNDSASASVALYGAHVMSYVPHGNAPVLWLSKAAKIILGQSIRGGVPICWPWFGAHPHDEKMPLHGLVRIVSWRLAEVREHSRSVTEICLQLTDKEMSDSSSIQPFQAQLRLVVSNTLQVSLEVTNTGTDELAYTAGLHSYFNIGDIGKVNIQGVDGKSCSNKESGQEEIQHGALTFDGLTTRIYHGIDTAVIADPVLQREIEVKAPGGDSIVIWNPGPGVERRFPGFAPGDERTMVCVEAANTEAMKLAVGETRFLAMEVITLPLYMR